LKIDPSLLRVAAPYGDVKQDTFAYVALQNVEKYPIYTIGKESYLCDAIINIKIHSNISIGRYCSIAANQTIQINQNHDYNRISTGSPCMFLEHTVPRKCQLIIQNDVWIGDGATIMGGITIRNGAVIAANSHVVKDVPPYAIVGGNPAKIIKYRFSEEQIADLQNIAWWDWDDKKMAETKDDFALPIEAFIEKHRVSTPSFSQIKAKNFDNPLLLFFADFHEPLPFWQHVVKSYFDNPIGKLVVCLQEELFIEKRLRELREFAASVYGGKGEIIEKVFRPANEEALFLEADCFVTSRSLETVRRTCLADKYGLKIISCADIPFGHELRNNAK
jgi:virginiamycin A acetyltransferase